MVCPVFERLLLQPPDILLGFLARPVSTIAPETSWQRNNISDQVGHGLLVDLAFQALGHQ